MVSLVIVADVGKEKRGRAISDQPAENEVRD